MQTNHYLEIGTDHRVCQDYAASGMVYNVKRGPTYYAIVCDGCSSAPHSEFGAQLITHCAVDAIKHHDGIDPNYFIVDVMDAAKQAVKHVGIDPRCLFATLLVARADTDNTHVWMWGDGAYRLTLKGDNHYTREVHYEGNAPYYPYYGVTSNEHNKYLQSFTCVKNVTYPQPDGHADESFSGKEALKPTTTWIETSLVKSVTLMSDGVGSFQDIDKVSVPSTDIIREVTAFKTTTGQYIERRMSAFKQRLCAVNQWTHYDDLSIAGVSL